MDTGLRHLPPGTDIAGGVVPATHSVLSAAALGEVLPDAYLLADPVRCRLLKVGDNDTYLVNDPSRSFVARVYRRSWRSSQDVAYELALLVHLAARQVPLARPCRRQRRAHAPRRRPRRPVGRGALRLRTRPLRLLAARRRLSWTRSSGRANPPRRRDLCPALSRVGLYAHKVLGWGLDALSDAYVARKPAYFRASDEDATRR